MDWKMPGLDGWDTTLTIRETHHGVTAPIIIMVSAYGRDVLFERLREKPLVLDGFLIKPVTASMLFDAVADAKAGTAHASQRFGLHVSSNRLKGLRLLVVEDNAMNQQVAFELLSGQGAIVSLASNGRLGVEAVLSANPPFDAILMDIQMPVMDGYAACMELRRTPRSHTIPIIATTANAISTEKEACFAAGMNDHVTKPIDLEILVSTILRHCGSLPQDVGAEVPLPSSRVEVKQIPLLDGGTDREYDRALQRMGGNKALFASLADRFNASAESMLEDIRKHLAEGKIAEALAVFHTLKGIAHIVGLDRIAEFVAHEERNLKWSEDAATAMAHLDDLVSLLRVQGSALSEFAATLQPKAQLQSVLSFTTDVSAAVATLLDELDALLEERNMRATTVFGVLKDKYRSSFGRVFEDLEAAVEDLDFRRAKEITQILRKVS
jgi:CheY-like chemotaxis protein